MSVKDGLLALLATGPAHGYQLKGDFEAATGEVWPLNVGQVYTSLQRLERDGLVEPDPDDADGDERRAYRLTAAGREHLSAWLTAPEEHTLAERDEVAMKILLAVRAPDEDPAAVISAQRAATMRTLQDLTRRKAARRDATLADVVHTDRMILRCRAELDWLDLAEARIDAAGNGTPHTRTTPAPAGPGEAR